MSEGAGLSLCLFPMVVDVQRPCTFISSGRATDADEARMSDEVSACQGPGVLTEGTEAGNRQPWCRSRRRALGPTAWRVT